MTTSADDISIVLSGGSTNINPNESLGGDPSGTPVTDAILNNLFDDVSSDESEEGSEEYRCIYIFNDGDTTVYDVQVYISEDFESGATMEIGINDKDELQRIQISGSPTGGNFTLSFNDVETSPIAYNADLSDWADAVRDALLEIEDIEEIQITGQVTSGGVIIFDILFNGLEGSRDQTKLEIENNLTGASTVTATVSVPRNGSPVNTIAPEIDAETTPPGGVGFSAATEQSPVEVPMLEPNDGFPLWIKRVVPAGSAAVEEDGFSLRIKAESIRS